MKSSITAGSVASRDVYLPDNFKAMFRPVAMIVPDLFLIASNIFMSNGFGADGGGATALTNKMVVLYALAAGQLSKQYHYDFKLRAKGGQDKATRQHRPFFAARSRPFSSE
jgi:hypothetical protein